MNKIDREILSLRKKGLSYARIAEKVGKSYVYAARVVRAEYDRINAEREAQERLVRSDEEAARRKAAWESNQARCARIRLGVGTAPWAEMLANPPPLVKKIARNCYDRHCQHTPGRGWAQLDEWEQMTWIVIAFEATSGTFVEFINFLDPGTANALVGGDEKGT